MELTVVDKSACAINLYSFFHLSFHACTTNKLESPRILNRKYCYGEHSNGYLGDITWAQASVGRHLRNLSSLFDTLSGGSRHIYEYPPRIVGSYPQLLQRHSSLLNSH